jgi:allantoinase
MTSTNPARIFGLAGKKGDLSAGHDADLVLVDPERQATLTPDALFYRNRHSAYVGSAMHGMVTRTLLRGLTIFAEGQIMVDTPGGQFLPGPGAEAIKPGKGSASQWG